MITADNNSATMTSGIRKCAILLDSIDRELAAAVMAGMEKNDAEKVRAAVAALGDVAQEERERVLEEFCRLSIAAKYAARGGVRYARSMLERCLPGEEAAELIGMLERNGSEIPFDFLQRAEPENLIGFIQNEHPQTIALVMSHLPVGKAAEVLAGLPPEKQIDVAERMVKMEPASPDVIRQVEKGLESRFHAEPGVAGRETDGAAAIADILNQTERTTGQTILETLEDEDPELVNQIRQRMFVFDDLLRMNGNEIKALLKEIDGTDLALALRTASDGQKEKVFSNMSEEAANKIREDIEQMGPVRVCDVEAAQQAIVSAARRLKEAAAG